jgi:murein DD-endopeptidase MepM/ murein hydrolase activator NlpD
MMRFRLHSLIAVVIAILLLPTLALSQTPPGTAAQQAPATQQNPMTQQTPPQGEQPVPQTQEPVQPVMSGPYPVMSNAALERGRQLFEMFSKAETSQMWAALSDGLRKRSGKEEKFMELNKKIRERMGPETAMLEENMTPYLFAPDTTYSRLSTYANVRMPVIASVTFNQRGEIDNFTINQMPPIAEGKYAGYEDQAKLHLPFQGEWLVYQGGRNLFENAYAGQDDSRYNVDFVLLKDGKPFSGTGGILSKNQDYYCWGQPILAPADGTISKAVGTYDDNLPGRPLGDSADGNVVVINHGNGEYSKFDHLKQNSLKVKADDKVKQGQVIAECGNSGVGMLPHIHYQFQRSAGVPLPAQFVDYIANGKPVASGEVVRGQLVKNAPSATPAPSNTGTSAKPPASK